MVVWAGVAHDGGILVYAPIPRGRRALASLGTIRIDTHDAPIVIVAEVDELRLEEVEAIARDPPSCRSDVNKAPAG